MRIVIIIAIIIIVIRNSPLMRIKFVAVRSNYFTWPRLSHKRGIRVDVCVPRWYGTRQFVGHLHHHHNAAMKPLGFGGKMFLPFTAAAVTPATNQRRQTAV